MDQLIFCPKPAYLGDVPDQDCPVKFDQIQRIMFTRLSASPHFTESNIITEASWTPRMIATDDTKIIGTPKFSGMVLPDSEPIQSGGNDNTTINGMPSLDGLPFIQANTMIKNMNAAAAKALRLLAPESAIQPGETDLGAYFINRFGEIIYRKVGSDALPFPVYNVIVTDVSSEGLNAPNVHRMFFALEPGWSQDFEMKKITAFNILSIKNAA
jgi:hypothetical protein